MWIAISFSNLVPRSAQCRTAGCGVCMGAAGLPSSTGQCRDQPVAACPSKTHIRTIPTKECAQAEPAGRDTSPRCAVWAASTATCCYRGRASLDESRVRDRLLSSFAHANFKRVFLPSSPWLFRMYFSDNFFILQTTHWHRAGFIARGNAKQGDKLTPTGHCRKKLASGSCSCQTFSMSGRSNQLQWCSKPRRRRRRRACGAQSMLQSKGSGRASWLLCFRPRAKSTK